MKIFKLILTIIKTHTVATVVTAATAVTLTGGIVAYNVMSDDTSTKTNIVENEDDEATEVSYKDDTATSTIVSSDKNQKEEKKNEKDTKKDKKKEDKKDTKKDEKKTDNKTTVTNPNKTTSNSSSNNTNSNVSKTTNNNNNNGSNTNSNVSKPNTNPNANTNTEKPSTTPNTNTEKPKPSTPSAPVVPQIEKITSIETLNIPANMQIEKKYDYTYCDAEADQLFNVINNRRIAEGWNDVGNNYSDSRLFAKYLAMKCLQEGIASVDDYYGNGICDEYGLIINDQVYEKANNLGFDVKRYYEDGIDFQAMLLEKNTLDYNAIYNEISDNIDNMYRIGSNTIVTKIAVSIIRGNNEYYIVVYSEEMETYNEY